MISVFMSGHDARENECRPRNLLSEDNVAEFIGREEILEAESIINGLKLQNADLSRKSEEL